MTNLIERLRGGVYGIDRIPLCAEAADELERLTADVAQLKAARIAFNDGKIDRLTAENAALREALELIAAPRRPDGTWNRERLACQQVAAAALKATK